MQKSAKLVLFFQNDSTPPKKKAAGNLGLKTITENGFEAVCERELWKLAEREDVSHESPRFDVDIEFACNLCWSLWEWLNETLLTEKEAAGVDSVHIDTFRRWRKDGKIKPTTADCPFVYRLSDVIALRRR